MRLIPNRLYNIHVVAIHPDDAFYPKRVEIMKGVGRGYLAGGLGGYKEGEWISRGITFSAVQSYHGLTGYYFFRKIKVKFTRCRRKK